MVSTTKGKNLEQGYIQPTLTDFGNSSRLVLTGELVIQVAVHHGEQAQLDGHRSILQGVLLLLTHPVA